MLIEIKKDFQSYSSIVQKQKEIAVCSSKGCYMLGIFDLNLLLLLRPRSLISFLILSSSVFGSTFFIPLL